MIKSSQARAIGRQMIRENKGILIGSSFVYTAVMSLVIGVIFFFFQDSMVSLFGSYLIVFLSVPLVMGVMHVNNMVYYKRLCRLANIFDFFRNYHVAIKVVGVAVIYSMLAMAIMMPVMLATFIPAVFAIAATGTVTDWAPFGMNAAFIPAIGLFVLSFVVALIVGLFMSTMSMAAYYLALRNRSITFSRLLSSSFKIGWKYVWKYTVFQLSFFGWILLSIVPMLLFAGIGIAWELASLLVLGLLLTLCMLTFLQAYILAASAAFYNVAIDAYEQQYPDYTNVAPHLPEAPKGSFQNMVDAKDLQDVHTANPVEPQEDTPPEHVEAEIVEIGGAAPASVLHDVILLETGINSQMVARLVSEWAHLDPHEALAFIATLPQPICADISLEQAREVAKQLTEIGARVEIQ